MVLQTDPASPQLIFSSFIVTFPPQQILVADRQVRAVEGSPQSVIVVVEFESTEAAQRWYDSPENTAVKGLRTSTTEGWLAIADGFVMPEG